MVKALCILGIISSSILALFSDGMLLSWLYIPWALYVICVGVISYKMDGCVCLHKFWLRPSIICMLSLIVVGFQLCIDDVLGFSSIESTIFSGASKNADRCFFSAAVFIFSYMLGLDKKKSVLFNQQQTFINSKYAIAWLILMILTFGAFISTIDVYFFLSGAAYQGSGAADYKFSLTDTLEGLYQIFFYITLACYIKIASLSQTFSESKSLWTFLKGFPLIFWICVILYLILRLLSGDRGPVIYNSLAIVYGFIWYSKHRFNFFTVVAAIILGASLVSFLGTFRSTNSELSLSEKITTSIDRRKDLNDKSVFNATKELAKSENTHFMAVRDIANSRTNYSVGRYALLSVTSAIPGLKRQYLYDLGLEPDEINSAVYFTISSQGKNYTSGEGSSMFGEAYLEFGILGMIIFGLLLGSVFKQLDLSLMQINQISVISLAVVLKLSAQAIYMGRTSFAIELGSALHMIVIFYIVNLVFKRFL